jgi:hypothetical protein
MIDVGFLCPCCGARTLSRPDAMELCPVCWWEDDGQDSDDPAAIHCTVNGDLSLHEARRNYQLCGAAHPRFVRYVRLRSAKEE